MARYTKSDTTIGDVVKTDINVQLGLIETAVADTLSRKGDAPNAMESDLDMNTNQILNLPDGVTGGEPLTIRQAAASATFTVANADAKYSTLAVAVADTTLVAGDVVIITDRASGIFDVISGTGTANTWNIVAHSTLSLSLELRDSEIVNVKQFGATGDASTDDLPVFQHAIDYVEQEGRVGGIVFAPKSAGYALDGELRIGGWTTLRGEGAFSTTLIFPASYTTGNCIALGPDNSGEFGYSGSYAFGCRIEDLDINCKNIYRGSNNSVIYTNGSHQPSAVVRVNIRDFVSIGIHLDATLGGQANYTVEDVNMQGSTTAPTTGNHIGLWCNGSGIQVNCQRVQVESNNTSPFDEGIKMQKDHLIAIDTHFEGCAVGVSCDQNTAGESMQNTLINTTMSSTTPILIQRGATNNNTLAVINARAESLSVTNLVIVVDNDTGFNREDGNVEFYSSRGYTSQYIGTSATHTIATGAITVTEHEGYFPVDTEAAASTDDLDTISGGTSGQTITIRPASTVRDVIIKHGTGNIYTKTGSDVTLDERYKTITLVYDLSITSWLEI